MILPKAPEITSVKATATNFDSVVTNHLNKNITINSAITERITGAYGIVLNIPKLTPRFHTITRLKNGKTDNSDSAKSLNN